MEQTFGGLDLSLTKTGIARVGAAGQTHRVFRPKTKGYQRLDQIVGEILTAVCDCYCVGVEGLITHSFGSSLTDMAGLWWVVTRELQLAGVVWVAISPPTLKKWATGKGNADKFAMFAAAMNRLGADVSDDNEADALWAAAACAQHYGQPRVTMPKAQVEALYALSAHKRRKGQPVIDWPAVPPVAAVAAGRN